MKQLLLKIEDEEINLHDLGFYDTNLRRLFAEDRYDENDILEMTQKVIVLMRPGRYSG